MIARASQRWLRSAAYRIAFVYSAAFALALGTLGVAVFAFVHREFERQIDDTVGVEARMLMHVGGTRDDLARAIALRERMGQPSGLLYAVFGPDKRRVLGSLDTSFPQLGLQTIAFADEDDSQDTARAYAAALPDGDRLLVAIDGDAIERSDRAIIVLFASVFACVLALCLLGAILLGGYLRARLKGISANAERIIAGDASARIALSARNDEFDRLAMTLNAMLDRNESLLTNLRQVSGDIAHDLRTPLSSLRHVLERGLDEASTINRGNARVVAMIGDALVRVDQILMLFGAILRISEIEGDTLRQRLIAFDISTLLQDIGDTYEPAIADSGRTLVLAVAPGLRVVGDAALITQAVVNLIDNARLHTPVGTTITLSANLRTAAVEITVADDGPGVAERDRSRILQRFVRLDPSRAPGGHGLGLSLVAAIATAHGRAPIMADAQPGLKVTISLPRASA